MIRSFSLAGRSALVTGASRGLGLEIARGLGQSGAAVLINGTNAERAAAAADILRSEGLDARPAVFDVSDDASVAQAIESIADGSGRLDILVNNVGVRLRRSLDDISPAELRALLDVNLVSAFALAKLSAPIMARGGYGRIINIGSIAAERGRAGDCAYIIAKGGINAMTRALAAEFGSSGITCNAILPGPFETETNRESFARPGMDAWFRDRILLGRPGKPQEIAGAAAFLASPAAGYVTGVCLPVDGGYLAAG